MQRRCLPAVLACHLVLAAAATARAAPLDEEACTQLKQEVQLLESRGARANMANGPAWAKANLASDKLAEIKSLIEIEEALAFRCPQPNAKPKPEKAEKAAPGTAGAATAAAAATAKAAPQRPRAKPKDETTAEEARRRQQTKAKAKPKPDDSYRPPPRRDTSVTAKPSTATANPGKAAPPRPKQPAQSSAPPPDAPFRGPFNSAY